MSGWTSQLVPGINIGLKLHRQCSSRHICISSYLHICKSANLHARMWVNRLLHIYCHLHCAMHIAQCASLTVNLSMIRCLHKFNPSAHSPLACWLLQVGMIFEMSSSIAGLVSYNVGACRMIPDVPTGEEQIVSKLFSGGKISFVFSLSLFVFTWNQFSNTGFERKCLRSCYEDSWNFEDILLSHLFGYLDICYFVQGISERNLVQRTKHGNVDKIWR